MSIFRNRFLNTASFLSAPDDPPAGGKKSLAEAVDSVEDTGDDNGGDDAGAGEDDAGGVEAAGEDGDSDSGGGEGNAEDDDPDLADLPAEVRAKAKAAIDRRVARETGWRDRQIDRLHAKRRSAEEDVRAAEAVVGRRADGTAAPENLTQAQIEERARALAKDMSAAAQYDQNANDADARGVGAYGDKWRSTMAKLPKLGGVDLADMVDILNTDQPHVVLYSLADPDTYERVMALPPARRRNEFVKLSLKDAPKVRGVVADKRPGDSPAPVRPINNGRKVAARTVDLADDKLSDDDWYAARNATRRKKFSDHA